MASRTYQFDFELTATSTHVTVGSNSVGYKTRNMAYQLQTDPAPTRLRIDIVDRDDLGAVIGTAHIEPTVSSFGSVTIAGIHYFPVPGDDLPTWLVDNNWHHYVYAAAAAGHMAGGTAAPPGPIASPSTTTPAPWYAAMCTPWWWGPARPGRTGPRRGAGRRHPGAGPLSLLRGRERRRRRRPFRVREATATFNDQVRVVAPKHLG